MDTHPISAANAKGSTLEDKISIAQNRAARKYSQSEMLQRIVWGLVEPFFRFSPRICFGWRRGLLRIFGARIGGHVHIYPSAKIQYPWLLVVGDDAAIGENTTIYNLGMIEIGARTTISQGAHLCAGTHDFTEASFPLVRAEIKIGDDCWICADAFIGPSVIIEANSIVGARAVVVKNVPPNVIVAGNPAKFVKHRPRVTSD